MFNSLLAILNSRKSMRQIYESSLDTVRMRPISGSRAGNMTNQHQQGDRKVSNHLTSTKFRVSLFTKLTVVENLGCD